MKKTVKTESLNEHDIAKKMIDTWRSMNLLRESDEGSDVISPNPTDSVYKEEVKKISDAVDPRIQITKFKIYPRDRNVEFEGRLDSGINFFMSTKAMKLSISITDDQGQPTRIYLDSELITTIQKLNGFYENWTREWAQKLNTEYRAK
jgi:hypothetical protein